VDLARGLAVIGMLAAHLLVRPELVWVDVSTWIAIVDGRSSILFATLAGVSIGLVTGGRTPVRGREMTLARRRLAVRAGALWVLGLVLILTGVPVFVILPAYAILFVLTIPFTRLRASVLFGIAGGLALVMPWVQAALDDSAWWSTPAGADVSLFLGWHYPFPVWLAFILAGLGVARAGVRSLRVQAWTLVTGIALALLGYGVDAASGSTSFEEVNSVGAAVWTARPHSSGLLEVIGSGGFALAVLAACLLLCRTAVRWVVLPLRAVGAMPLTAYTAQILVWAVWAAAAFGDTGELAGFRELAPFWPLTLGIVASCTAWALLVGRGPLEALIDGASRLLVRDRRPESPPDRLAP
jgi:hypothetical protein